MNILLKEYQTVVVYCFGILNSKGSHNVASTKKPSDSNSGDRLSKWIHWKCLAMPFCEVSWGIVIPHVCSIFGCIWAWHSGDSHMYYSIHGVILILPCTEVTSGWNLDDCYIWFFEDMNDLATSFGVSISPLRNRYHSL